MTEQPITLPVGPGHDMSRAVRYGICRNCGTELWEQAITEPCTEGEPRNGGVGVMDDDWAGGFADNH